MQKKWVKIILLLLTLWMAVSWTIRGYAASIPLEIFPLKKYDQNVDHWIKPNDPNYRKPLVDENYQKDRLQDFYNHYFSSEEEGLSPWSKTYIEKTLGILPSIPEDSSNDSIHPQALYHLQSQLIKKYSNEGQEDKDKDKGIGYGENYRPLHASWINKIAENMNVDQFKNLTYHAENKGITVQNAYVRVLPTSDPHFYHFEIPGEGYPFDNLQMTDIWAGTPIYIVGESRDKHWSLIVSPDVTGWIQTEAIASVDQKFIEVWQQKAKQNLIAITHTEAPIFYLPNEKPLIRAYVGSVFPLIAVVKDKSHATSHELDNKQEYLKILFPVKNPDGTAFITHGFIKREHGSLMPLAATPHNFARIIKTLQNRPYGWGGLYFYNDCSQELKNLYTPFGFYLPRNSGSQEKAGKMVDLIDKSRDERIQYLMEQGHPMMSIVYIGAHVFMYLGNYPNPNAKDHALMPMTYQNLWALKPEDKSRRSVIGQSLLFPLLKVFSEDSKLNSQANDKDFRIIYLDQWPDDQQE